MGGEGSITAQRAPACKHTARSASACAVLHTRLRAPDWRALLERSVPRARASSNQRNKDNVEHLCAHARPGNAPTRPRTRPRASRARSPPAPRPPRPASSGRAPRSARSPAKKAPPTSSSARRRLRDAILSGAGRLVRRRALDARAGPRRGGGRWGSPARRFRLSQPERSERGRELAALLGAQAECHPRPGRRAGVANNGSRARGAVSTHRVPIGGSVASALIRAGAQPLLNFCS